MYNENPTVTINSIDCNTLRYSTTDGDAIGASLRVHFIVDGAIVDTLNNQTPGSNRTYDTQQWRDVISHDFSVRVVDTTAGGSTANSSTETVGPCVTVSCESINPASAGLGTGTFDASFGFRLSLTLGSRVGNKTYDAQLNFNGSNYTMYTSSSVQNGTTDSGILNSGSGSGPFPMSSNNIPVPATEGIYPVTITLNGLSVPPASCGGTINVLRQPYFRAYGSDVISCGTGDVRGLFNGSPALHSSDTGAGVELAIFAIGEITGVLPGSMQPRSALYAMGFSNTTSNVSISASRYGGGFNSCYAGATYEIPTDPSISSSGNPNVGRFAAGEHEYNYTGPAGTALTGSLGPGERVVVYVSGDVSIGDIRYSDLNWATIDDIPSFKVIATGNIYIRDTVSELDGHFISTGGDIHTCSGQPGGRRNLLDNQAQDRAWLATNCATQLIVNGSLTANRVHMLRTNGTLADGVPFEQWDGSNNPRPNNIAEVFRFSPEAYIVNGGGIRPDPSENPSIDSIISRPPAF